MVTAKYIAEDNTDLIISTYVLQLKTQILNNKTAEWESNLVTLIAVQTFDEVYNKYRITRPCREKEWIPVCHYSYMHINI